MHRKLVPEVVSPCSNAPTVGKTTTAQEAAMKMTAEKVPALAVVTDDGALCGLISEHDLAHRVLGERKNAATTTVADVMSNKVDVLATTDSVLDAFTLMMTRHYQHLPVTDSTGAVVAIVSIDNLAHALRDTIDEKLAQDEQSVFGAQ